MGDNCKIIYAGSRLIILQHMDYFGVGLDFKNSITPAEIDDYGKSYTFAIILLFWTFRIFY